MITYIGGGFVLFGMFLFLISALAPSGFSISLALGVVVFGMGVVLSYVGSRLHSDPESQDDAVEEKMAQPLSYVLSKNEQVQGMRERASGEKALGFVLISLGSFVLTVAGVFGLFIGAGPLTPLGAGLVFSGVLLRRR